MPKPNTLHAGRLLKLDGHSFVIDHTDGDDVHLIQLARPGEHVARGPWIYSRIQVEAALAGVA